MKDNKDALPAPVDDSRADAEMRGDDLAPAPSLGLGSLLGMTLLSALSPNAGSAAVREHWIRSRHANVADSE